MSVLLGTTRMRKAAIRRCAPAISDAISSISRHATLILFLLCCQNRAHTHARTHAHFHLGSHLQVARTEVWFTFLGGWETTPESCTQTHLVVYQWRAAMASLF